MRGISVMGSIVKHCLGLFFFFVLGLVIGAIPLGILCTPFCEGKDAPVFGALIGGICLAFAYVQICLVDHSEEKKDSQANELLVKQFLGLCFWGFAGFVGGAVLLAWLYTFFTDAYSQWQIEVGILGGFLGAGCLSAGYIVTCRCGFSLRKKGGA
jgi:hypothetical protein